MPSIPQSLLWISLVVLWLFVLVPMLVSKRDAVRRTSDVALATRVLNSGAAARLLRRGGPAAGHRSNPDWKPDEDEYENLDSDDTEEMPLSRAAAPVAVEESAPEDLDAEADDTDSAVLPVADEQPQPVAEIDTEDEDTDAEFETEDAEDDDATTWNIDYLYDVGLMIGGGSNNIQKNIIAERGLDLPREPKVARP